MASVEFQHVFKQFGPTAALRDISFRAAEGEFLVIVGPSGCGKSTLLRLVAGLEAPDSGRILIGDVDMTAKEPKARGVAMVFQSYALYPHWSVRENVGFPLKLRGEKKSVIETRVTEIASSLRLTDQLAKRPKELSGGQRQRVALGRAIAADPKIFLFDEPLSNLDAPLRAGMRREIVSQQRALKKTALYVTHDQTEALTMADRVVVLNAGELMGEGSPESLYNDPPTRFVAEFLGRPAINVITAQVVSNSRGASVESLGWDLQSAPETAGANRELDIAVRPEHLTLDSEGSGRNWVLKSREFLGDKLQYTVERDGVSLLVLSNAQNAISLESSVRITPQGGRVLFFDPQSGERLR